MKFEMSAEQYRRVALGQMPEKEWRKAVKEAAGIYGWEVLFEVPDRAYQTLADALAPYDPKRKHRVPISGNAMAVLKAVSGWPDLFLGHRNMVRHLWVELKTTKGTLNDAQKEKIPQMRECGCQVEIWKPGDDIDSVLGGEHG